MPSLCYNSKRLTAPGGAGNTTKGLTTMLVHRRQSVMAKSSLPENRFYVYILRRPDKVDPFDEGRGCPFYIGKGCNGRKRKHYLEAKELLGKTGIKNYKISIIHLLWKHGLNYEIEVVQRKLVELEAFDLECALISKYGRKDNGTGILANLTNGGEGPSGCCSREKGVYHHSEETRRKISIAVQGKTYNQGMKGKKHSEDTKHKMSKVRKGKIKTLEHCHNLSISLKGKTRTDEVKKAQSERQKGRKLTIEWRRKIAEAGKGRVFLEETRKKISESKYKPIMINGVKFSSIKVASIELNLNYHTLMSRFHRKTQGYERLS